MTRILTTHTGSLPRPPALAEQMLRLDRREAVEDGELRASIASATAEVVKRQVDIGLDIVSDGEFSKVSYATYVKERLTGFDGAPRSPLIGTRDREEFPDFDRSGPAPIQFPTNSGPVTLRDPEAVRRDVAALTAALEGLAPHSAFMTAASPGVIDTFMPTTYYPNDRAYLTALADAMRDEYRTIVEAGFTLQVDCPDVAMSRTLRFANLSDAEFVDVARLHVEVLADVLRDLPREKLRLHLCWGNYEGPHNHDIPLAAILDVVLQAPVGAISFEAANPRHAHEWEVFSNVSLPPDCVLIPGVIDTCTNYIEHPRLVAQRLERFAHIVGPDRVIASTDCGFGTAIGMRRVAPSIAWAKLEALIEGAHLI
jgi:5-methyltetrahydropteroyltriglutamate--homocysteine methyltransferase